MPDEWTTVLLADCGTWLSGGTPSKARSDYWGGNMPWVSAKDMKQFRLYDAEDHVTHDGARNGTRVIPAGTILLLIRGMTLHYDVPICVAMTEMAFNQDVKAIVPRTNINKQFLAYWFVANKPYLLSQVDSASHGTGRLYPEMLKQTPVLLPPTDEQQAIANVLGALDDKIELNQRMNETLESMARALFQSWFVDFDPVRARMAGRQPFGMDAEVAALFPCAFTESLLGEIPQGWQAVRLTDIFDVNPPRRLRIGEVAPYLDMANMPTRSARANGVVGRAAGSGSRFANGDTLVARITPCLENGKTAFVDFLEDGQIGWGSTEYIVLQPKPPIPAEYAYFVARLESFRNFAITNMTGTSGRQRVSGTSFEHFNLIAPHSAIAESFCDFARRSFATMRANDEQSCTLSTIRDTLLPKLMSGEVRVRDAEKTVEEAV